MKKALYLFVLSILSHSIMAQNISGYVKNTSGEPIQNALVTIFGNNSEWTKTGNDGSFSLAGNTNNQLKIAALHYQTITDFSISTTTGIEITMQEDALLQTDVYHISFDHLRPGDYYSKEELKDDFPVPSGIGFYEPGDEGSNRAFVDTEESIDPNGQSLRVKFPAGELKTAHSGIDARIPLAKTYKDNDFNGEELYLSYWIKWSENFDLDRCGGKLPSLGGSDLGTRENVWKGRIMWRNGGSIQFYMELPHDEDGFDSDAERFWGEKEYDGGDICTNRFTPYLKEPGWHNIELHYKLDNGTPTGLFEGWVDGDKGHKIINSEVFGFYRRKGEDLENLTINAILLSAFFGGSSEDYEPEEDVYAWFDEFRVSTQRINEYDKYAGDIVTNLSETETIKQSIYPNPSNSGIFHIEEATPWLVLNSVGKIIASGKGEIIDLSKQTNGIYFIKTDTSVKKIIKQ